MILIGEDGGSNLSDLRFERRRRDDPRTGVVRHGKRRGSTGQGRLRRYCTRFLARSHRSSTTEFGSNITFLVADMALPRPCPDGSIDAVMSNVALHMFPDSVTRSLFDEIGRLMLTDGLILVQVNAR